MEILLNLYKKSRAFGKKVTGSVIQFSDSDDSNESPQAGGKETGKVGSAPALNRVVK